MVASLAVLTLVGAAVIAAIWVGVTFLRAFAIG